MAPRCGLIYSCWYIGASFGSKPRRFAGGGRNGCLDNNALVPAGLWGRDGGAAHKLSLSRGRGRTRRVVRVVALFHLSR